MQASGLCFEVLVNGANYLLKLYRARCAFVDIKTFSDEQLRDIGLTRQDVYAVDRDCLFKDPTGRLRDLVNARRTIELNSEHILEKRGDHP